LTKRAQRFPSKPERIEIGSQSRSTEEIQMSEAYAFHPIPNRILLPLDFSASSDAALEMAAEFAFHFHAELILVNVLPLIPPTTLPYLASNETIPHEAKIESLRQLAKCHAELVAKGVRSISLVEGGDDVAESIMEVIDREHVDMVVISTHGSSGWHSAAFGSVAQKVLKQVKCPLLLLRSESVKTATVAA
jgi:nucleotide-binding universal stress UspA family protein